MRASHIVILTGAGVSAESGLGTFRDVGGLWTKYDLADVATPEGYVRNPALVQKFYNARRVNCANATPNPAHAAIAVNRHPIVTPYRRPKLTPGSSRRCQPGARTTRVCARPALR